MKLFGTLAAPRVNFPAYRARLHARLSEAIAQAAVAWLGRVTTIVPVWSGASQATFLPLASEIDFHLSIAPVVASRIDLGLTSADGRVTADRERGEYRFHYETTLAHLIYNEFNNANLLASPTGRQWFHLRNPGPYHFQEAGQSAFARVARDVRLPSPFEALTVQKIKVG